MKKRFMMFLLLAATILALAACGKFKTSSDTETGFDDIGYGSEQTGQFGDYEYSIQQDVDSDNDSLCLNFTNHSSYDLLYVEMQFDFKEDTSNEEKDAVYKYLQNVLFLADEDIEELRSEKNVLTVCKNASIEAGEECSYPNPDCYYFGYIDNTENIRVFDCLEPVMATVRYVDHDEIYTENFDLKKDSSSVDSEIMDLNQWDADNSKRDDVPEPKGTAIFYDGIGNYTVYGITHDDYEAYIKECQDAGYEGEEDDAQADADSNKYVFSAEKGFDERWVLLDITYDENAKIMVITIDREA